MLCLACCNSEDSIKDEVIPVKHDVPSENPVEEDRQEEEKMKAVMKQQEEDAAAQRKKEEEAAAQRRKDEEAAARKKQEEEAAAQKKKEEEDAARKKKEEEEAEKAKAPAIPVLADYNGNYVRVKDGADMCDIKNGLLTWHHRYDHSTCTGTLNGKGELVMKLQGTNHTATLKDEVLIWDDGDKWKRK